MLHAEHHAQEVHVQNALPFGEAVIGEGGLGRAHAGVVERPVQTAPTIDCDRDHAPNIVLAPDVAADPDPSASRRLHRLRRGKGGLRI